MHIGLIGGIGPAATVVYYERLVSRFRDADLPLDLTIVQADTNTLVGNAQADRRDEQASIYAELIARLKAAGADFAAITSLGGHFCFPETIAISPLPLLNALTPMDTYFASKNIQRIGLLGTKMVMETRLYGQLKDTQSFVPPGDLHAVGQDYIEMALQGFCEPDRRTRFFERAREMVNGQGADAVLMAGTNLGLAFDGHDPGCPMINAVDIHVDALFRLATSDPEVADGLLTKANP